MIRLPDRLVAAFWNGIAGALPRLAVLLAGLYVAQRFGADAFARYSLALSTFALAGSLPGSTMSTVASKFVPEFSGDDVARRGEGFAAITLFAAMLAAAVGGALALAAPALATLFGVEPPIDGLLRAAAAAVAACILAGGLVGLLVGSADFATAALAQAAGFAVFAAAIAPAADHFGLMGALAALAALHLGAATVALLAARRGIARDARSPRLRDRVRPICGFFVPTMIAAGLVAPVVWLSNVLISKGPEPLPNLARFGAAYSWFAVLSFVPAVLAQVEFVRMSRAKARGDTAKLAGDMRRFMARNAKVMLPLTLAGAALAAQLVGVYRLEGSSAERPLVLLLAAAFVASLGNPAGLFLAVVDRIWLASGLNASWGIITLALAWWLRDHGASGVALAFLMGYAIHFVVATLIAQRLLARGPGP